MLVWLCVSEGVCAYCSSIVLYGVASLREKERRRAWAIGKEGEGKFWQGTIFIANFLPLSSVFYRHFRWLPPIPSIGRSSSLTSAVQFSTLSLHLSLTLSCVHFRCYFPFAYRVVSTNTPPLWATTTQRHVNSERVRKFLITSKANSPWSDDCCGCGCCWLFGRSKWVYDVLCRELALE